MTDTYQDMEPGYLNLNQQSVLDRIATHELYVEFDGEREFFGTIYNNNKLTIEFDPSNGIENPKFTVTSKSGKKFTLGMTKL